MLKRGAPALFGFIAIITTLVACKREDPAPPPPPAAATDEPLKKGEPEVDAQMLASVQNALDTNFYKGTGRQPPQQASKPQPNKKVWIISPGQIGESASIPTNAAKE